MYPFIPLLYTAILAKLFMQKAIAFIYETGVY